MSYASVSVILSVVLIHQSGCVEESRNDGNVQILTYEYENDVSGSYRFKYETADGTSREETGKITNPESDNAILIVYGSYSYISPEGQRYTVRYVADEKGFRPEIRLSVGSAARPKNTNPFNRIGGAAVSSLQGGGLG